MSYRISLSEGVASVVSSRQRSGGGVLVIWIPIPTGQMLHIALRCLEGSTMSNLVHRRRRCARIDLHSIPCLEGSTPEDRSRADTQAAPVGRRMCGISIPRVSLRSALG